MSGTTTHTTTYTTEDVAKVIRRFAADLKMIAASSKSITEAKAADYAFDVEYLAQRGYLKKVDVTLLSDGVEKKAVQYFVLAGVPGLTAARPGDVLWPEVTKPRLRILLWHTDEFTAEAEKESQSKLKNTWSSTNADTTHATLKQSGTRDYSSNDFGFNRKDFS